MNNCPECGHPPEKHGARGCMEVTLHVVGRVETCGCELVPKVSYEWPGCREPSPVAGVGSCFREAEHEGLHAAVDRRPRGERDGTFVQWPQEDGTGEEPG